MSFLDKILSVMKLNDEYEDEDFFDEEGDDYEVESGKTSPFRRAPQREDVSDLDDFDGESSVVRKFPKNAGKSTKAASAKAKAQPMSTSSKVSPIRTRKSAIADMAVCVVKPKSMEDAREITETLLSNCTVVLNMEGLDLDLAQRIIDFTSGSCYAISGNLQKISNYIFIITPSDVDVSGDFQDILSGAFDVPPMKSPANYNVMPS